MAELTGVEPVPAERQSAILPIDHSSGSLPWTRTTISAFRAQRPAIGRRGNFEIVKELVAGERFERPYPDSKSRVLPLDDPASRFQRYRFHAPHAQDRRLIEVVAKLFANRCEHGPQARDDFRRDRNTAPTQPRSQNRRVQSFACS